jgi:ATP-dependent helicase/nuclease subunit A
VTTWHVIEAGESRAATYGDIMVLVRNRTYLTVYEAALRDKNIPFLSSRRGGLLDTLEAQDLQTVLLFLITPFADLALAHTLRTPIFACDDHDLMQLAGCEIEGSEKPAWWRRLRHLATTGEASAKLLRAHRLLENWLRFSDSLPVHDLLDRIYFEGEVVARYAAVSSAALRAKVEANLHSFMEIALSVDAGRYPSLPRFLQNCRELRESADDAPNEGKLGVAGDAVRIYTVHESKGLEAPIVWLLDANSLNEHNESYNVLLDWPSSEARPTHFSVFADLASRGKQRTEIFDREAQQQAREEMNLLYVATTRAKQVLLVSGYGKDAASEEKKKSLSWYDRIKNVTNVAVDNPLKISVPKHLDDDKPATVLATKSTLPPAIFPIGKRRAENTLAQQRGTWLHGLLQYLAPETATSQHPVSVDQTELQQRLAIPADEGETLWQQAQFILSQSELQRYFEPSQYHAAVNELAYVNAAGELKRIDRLVEFADEVWVLDYKLGDAENAVRYQSQMAEYRVAMQAIYVTKKVRCALLFADGTWREMT